MTDAGSKPWWLMPWLVFDTETTGFDPEQGHRIIELGAVEFDNGEVSGKWGTLLDPERELPADTTRITGIRPADVRGQPKFGAVAEEFVGRFRGRLIVAYNAEFDRRFLLHELARVGIEMPPDLSWIDPLVLARQLHKGRGKMKLGLVAERLGIPLEEAHRAVADAECTGLVLRGLADEGNLPADLDEFLDLQEQWAAEHAAQRRKWRRRDNGDTVTGKLTGPRNSLGVDYPHNEVELDPVRYMFLRAAGRARR